MSKQIIWDKVSQVQHDAKTKLVLSKAKYKEDLDKHICFKISRRVGDDLFENVFQWMLTTRR